MELEADDARVEVEANDARVELDANEARQAERSLVSPTPRLSHGSGGALYHFEPRLWRAARSSADGELNASSSCRIEIARDCSASMTSKTLSAADAAAPPRRRPPRGSARAASSAAASASASGSVASRPAIVGSGGRRTAAAACARSPRSCTPSRHGRALEEQRGEVGTT